jgi:hypothetical protein
VGRRRTPTLVTALSAAVVVAAIALVVVVGGGWAPRTPAGAAAGAREPGPFRGLGTWVDAFDYVPSRQQHGAPPPVTPASVADMAALGVRTLYLQVVGPDDPAAGSVAEPVLLGEFLSAAHRSGLAVVGWYLPFLDDVDADLAVIGAMTGFRSHGQRFDAYALDIEWTQGVRDPDQRSAAAVSVAKHTRALVGSGVPLGATVYPAVQTEVLNVSLWPRFPYQRLARSVDVWMPMVYWTFRDGTYRDPATYTAESVARLRDNLGDRRALVHPIGGIADGSTPVDDVSFLRAVRTTRSVGWSLYDFNTTASSAWPLLRAGPEATVTTTTSTTTSAATTGASVPAAGATKPSVG